MEGDDNTDEPSRTSVVLQFGRIGDDTFTMDVRWPLSLYQAFSICTACLDGKIADRMGYAYLKSMIK